MASTIRAEDRSKRELDSGLPETRLDLQKWLAVFTIRQDFGDRMDDDLGRLRAEIDRGQAARSCDRHLRVYGSRCQRQNHRKEEEKLSHGQNIIQIRLDTIAVPHRNIRAVVIPEDAATMLKTSS